MQRAVQPHEECLGLGGTTEQRCVAYGALLLDAIGQDRLDEIRVYVQQRAWDTSRFQAAIEAELQRVAKVRPRGRPIKIPIDVGSTVQSDK